MSHEEFNELVLYISDLKQQFNRKLDEQTMRINQQNLIIDELCWQLREMGSNVRTLNTNLKKAKQQLCNCVYENYFPTKSNKSETISGPTSSSTSNSSSQNQKDTKKDTDSNQNKKGLQSQYSTISGKFKDKREDDVTDRVMSPIYETIDVCAQIAENKTTSTATRRAEEEGELQDYLDEDNVLRQKVFKEFNSNSRRGSSKPLCSQISNIEESYLPTEEQLRNSNVVYLTRDSIDSFPNLRLTYIKDSVSNSIDI